MSLLINNNCLKKCFLNLYLLYSILSVYKPSPFYVHSLSQSLPMIGIRMSNWHIGRMLCSCLCLDKLQRVGKFRRASWQCFIFIFMFTLDTVLKQLLNRIKEQRDDSGINQKVPSASEAAPSASEAVPTISAEAKTRPASGDVNQNVTAAGKAVWVTPLDGMLLMTLILCENCSIPVSCLSAISRILAHLYTRSHSHSLFSLAKFLHF